MRVAIIGAGPAGLVTLKHLLAAESALGVEPVEARLFESESGVGGTFLARTYEDAEVGADRFLVYPELVLSGKFTITTLY